MPTDHAETSPRINRPASIVSLAIAAVFLSVALFHGLRTTRDLEWHPGNDAYRDIALAQIILDGDYPADYLIEDEWLWYNLLTGAQVAAGAWLGDIAPPQADVRLGPWLNLTVPIAFFLLVWYLTDVWIALVALRRLDQLDNFAPYHWIAENTPPGAVFLCNDRPGLYCVAAAGARVVANDPYFSSLYVPYAPRVQAREVLWSALREKDEKTFRDAAAAWRVAYVLAEGEQRDWAIQSGFSGLEEVFASNQFTIYRLPVWIH